MILLDDESSEDSSPVVAEEKPAALDTLNSDVFGVICANLGNQELGQLSQTSHRANELVKKTPVKNSFKFFGNVSDAYAKAKTIENVENIDKKIPLFVAGASLVGLLAPPAAIAGLPVAFKLYDGLKKQEHMAHQYLSDHSPVAAETTAIISRAKYLDSSIFHKLSEFDRLHPQYLTAKNIATGIGALLAICVCPPAAGAIAFFFPAQVNFLRQFLSTLQQTFERFDEEIKNFKDTKTAFRTLTGPGI